MRTQWMALLFPLALMGCQPNLAAVSAGHIGCVPAKVAISDYEQVSMNAASWTATCGDRVFTCSGAGNSLACSPLDESHAEVWGASEPATAPAPPKAAPRQAQWVRKAIDACGIEAEFPAPPVLATEETKTRVGALTTYSAVASRADEWAVGLSCLKLSEIKQAKRSPLAKLLNAMRDGMLKSVGGELVDERHIIGGREVDFTVAGKDCRARLLVLDDKLVTASVTPVSGLGAAKATQFFRSVGAVVD